ncbi:MAG: hypothetical protein COA79_20430 [Planctomycetota bacterium]|nr:MAG: hypothetical protein COA79_20430 [Planctomycetota bacterium]
MAAYTTKYPIGKKLWTIVEGKHIRKLPVLKIKIWASEKHTNVGYCFRLGNILEPYKPENEVFTSKMALIEWLNTLN